MNGILCINKPQGFTSFDVVAKLRGMLKIKRIGHAGTLDPMATGVLPIFVGSATKACDIMPDNHKSYTASFMLGMSTDTQDSTGKTLTTSDVTSGKSEIEKILPQMTGSIMQIPPMYSAVSVNGKRLYELARQGIEIEREPRNIIVDKLQLIEFNDQEHSGVLQICCSKGTYVRTIIHDIGQALGCGAVMTSLVRTSSNGFDISESVTLEKLQKYVDCGKTEELIIPIERVFSDMPAVYLNNQNTKLYRNGVKLNADSLNIVSCSPQTKFRVFSSEKSFIGLAHVHDGCLRVYKNFT